MVKQEIRLFTYKLTHDTGFAPCPFGGLLTLATCKPGIRKTKKVGDWIAGFTSKRLNNDSQGSEKLIYLMEIIDKIPFEKYWFDKRFQKKKVVLDSEDCLEKIGDNIYKPLKENPKTIDDFLQVENPYHGDEQKLRDLKGRYVLISKNFYYFGRSPITLNSKVRPKTPKGQSGQGVRTYDEIQVLNFLSYIKENYKNGIYEKPFQWFRDDKTWMNDENYIK